MKKKIVALCLVAAMAVTAVVGGTLAYFTDTDAKDNTFTVGKVDIALDETFDENNAKLVPGVDINKDVKIKLESGSEPSYVWYEWLIPAVLDSTDGSTGTNNIVHVNSKGSTWDDYRNDQRFWDDNQNEALPLNRTWDHDPNEEIPELVNGPEGFIGTEEIGGIVYNKYAALYHGILDKDNPETTIGMTNVYLDRKVDYDPTTGLYTCDGKSYDLNNVKIIVRAYGIQAAGFDDVYAAYKAYQDQK